MLSWTLGVQQGIPCAEMNRAFVCPSTANLIFFNSCIGQRWLLSPSSQISHYQKIKYKAKPNLQ